MSRELELYLLAGVSRCVTAPLLLLLLLPGELLLLQEYKGVIIRISGVK